MQCFPFGEVDFVDIEARLFFPCNGCPPLGGVDVVDPEANFYSALLCGDDLLDSEARIYFLQCSFYFLVKPMFLTSRHELLFPFLGALVLLDSMSWIPRHICSSWITFDIRTLGMKLCLQMIHGYGFYVFLLSVT